MRETGPSTAREVRTGSEPVRRRIVPEESSSSFSPQTSKGSEELRRPSYRDQGRSSSVPILKQKRTGTFNRVASHFEKQRARIKQELEGWRRHFRIHGVWKDGKEKPVLTGLEPVVVSTDGIQHSMLYRASLSLFTESHEHRWQTELFTLDELIAVVVKARRAKARKWQEAVLPKAGTRICPKQFAAAAYLLRTVLLWCMVLLIALRLTRAVRPWLLWVLNMWTEALGHMALEPGLIDWILSFLLVSFHMASMAACLAGFAEMSFFPAKAILQLERKDETEQVKSQLLLLLTGGCLEDLVVCNFLNIGMATFYNSSETQKEGRCLCRRHEPAEESIRRSSRQRLSLFCCSLEWRLRVGRNRGFDERWMVLRKDGIALFASVLDQDPTDMLFFDTSFAIFRDDDTNVFIHGASWVLELEFAGTSHSKVQAWCNAITVTAQLSPRTREQRFGSFAPQRFPAQAKEGDRHLLRRSMSKFLINGKETFRSIAEAILMAEHEIFILSFFLSPNLPLVREGEALPNNADPRLSSLLRGAADRGVRVYVLLFHETMLPNDSEWAEASLQHKNIFVVRHRSLWDSNRLWTHHEKVVVVDQQLAIVGGLDICIGRYDDCRHRLLDPAHIWEGQDYYNPRIKDVSEGRKSGDLLNRQAHPRLPWQDIACVVLGRGARDVARHCVERWNHAKFKRVEYQNMPTTLLKRKVAMCNDRIVSMLNHKAEKASSWPPEIGDWEECEVQVVRSVSRWSAGTKTESSLHQSGCDLLQDAERFVYIENQFFCSGLDGDNRIGNRVAEALFRRVVKAHAERQTFHIMLVMPLLPALEAAIVQANISQPVLCVMNAQYLTLRGLRSRLASVGVSMSDYISVYGLRTYAAFPGDSLVTEQIYVHSKALIIDDRIASVGSANFNDRSLLGMRDSEVNIHIQGQGFASGLRKALYAQHLGWSSEQLNGEFADPASAAVVAEVKRIARNNTAAYEEVFKAIPSDEVRTWAELLKRRGTQLPRDFITTPTAEKARRFMEEGHVQGFLVEFPIDFLADEDLASSTGSLLSALFT